MHRPETATERAPSRPVQVGAGRRKDSLTTRHGTTEWEGEKPFRPAIRDELEGHTPSTDTQTSKLSSTFKLFGTLGA